MPTPNPPQRLSSETLLLLECARPRADHARIRALGAAPLDWARFLALANWHGIASLAYRGLKSAGEGSGESLAPPAVANELHSAMVIAAVNGAKLHAELLRILGLLKAAGVAALPYKGTTLAHLAFGGVAFRQAGDIDLLIRQRDYWRTREALCANGYHPLVEYTRRQEEEYVASARKYHFPFVPNGGGAEVEVHWSLTMRSYRFWWFDLAKLWERAREIEIAGRPLPHPSLEETLVILSVHGSTHCWSRLKWICDLAWLIDRRRDLDLSAALARATELGCRRRLLLGLAAARETLGTDLPPAIDSVIAADPRLPALLARVYESIDKMEEPYDARLMLDMADGNRGKLAYYLRKTFVPTEDDRQFLPLPPSLRFLLWGIRPIRLLFRRSPGR